MKTTGFYMTIEEDEVTGEKKAGGSQLHDDDDDDDATRTTAFSGEKVEAMRPESGES
jgi:hypothetical protein